MTNFNENSDIIDSRDICERIKELESLLEDHPLDKDKEDDFESEREELQTLTDIVETINQYSGDSAEDGVTLISESHFEDYAKELAENCGMINKNAQWPNTFIDWEAAAEALQEDYTSVEYNGETFWFR